LIKFPYNPSQSWFVTLRAGTYLFKNSGFNLMPINKDKLELREKSANNRP